MANKNSIKFADGVLEKALKENKYVFIIDEQEKCIGYFKECPVNIDGARVGLNVKILEEKDGVVTNCEINSVSLIKPRTLDSEEKIPYYINLPDMTN